MEKNIVITATNMSELVRNSFMKCLFKEGEDTSNYVKVEGIMKNFGLHPQRLEEQRELVTAMLAELPVEFKDGWTFLNICANKNGELWTGEHSVCEQLIVMAIGLNLMDYCFPREIWAILPGGVPYLIVK